MVILITGTSHTGKTNLAQSLLEKYKYPYLSIDHLKMGLIRSGNTDLTPLSEDEKLTDYLWNIVKEIVKTAIENEQNLIVEGCYIPFDWQKDFEKDYLSKIKFICLVMSKRYIETHFDDIEKYSCVIEKRLNAMDFTIDELIEDNEKSKQMCEKYKLPYVFIDEEYDVNK